MSKKTNPDKKARLKERKEAINLKDSNTDATEELVESEDENRHEEDQQCNCSLGTSKDQVRAW